MFDDFRKVFNLLNTAQKRQALVVFILMLLGMCLETLGVGIVIPVLGLLTGAMVGGEDGIIIYLLRLLAGSDATQTELAAVAMITMAVLFITKTIFLAAMYWLQFRFIYQLQADLSRRLFRKYLENSMAFHAANNSAILIRNVNQEVNLFTQGALMGSFIFFTEFLVVLGIITLLLLIEPLGAIIVFSVMCAASWVFLQVTKSQLGRWGQLRHEMDGRKIQFVQQGIGAIKDVKILGREGAFMEAFDFPNRVASQVAAKQNFVVALPRLWLELLAVLGLVALVLMMIAQGRPLDELAPILGLFAAAAFRLLPSANRLVSATQNIRFNRPAIDVLHREMLPTKLTSQKLLASADTPPLPFTNRITIRDLSFSYEGADGASLQNISFDVRHGQSVGIIGASGAGKSTLVDLMLGVLTPQQGQVAVDGQNVHHNLRRWQKLIGYVPQDIYLTDTSLLENIAFGLDPATVDANALNHAVAAAHLNEVVAEAEHGLHTMVGERGIKLSGGQRQRIGIARALYHNPKILVLDEATSALDTTTERSVMAAINNMKGEKTMIIITHRLSTLDHADVVIELDKGRIKSIR